MVLHLPYLIYYNTMIGAYNIIRSDTRRYGHVMFILTSYCTVLDFIHECLFCFYFDEALAESK